MAFGFGFLAMVSVLASLFFVGFLGFPWFLVLACLLWFRCWLPWFLVWLPWFSMAFGFGFLAMVSVLASLLWFRFWLPCYGFGFGFLVFCWLPSFSLVFGFGFLLFFMQLGLLPVLVPSFGLEVWRNLVLSQLPKRGAVVFCSHGNFLGEVRKSSWIRHVFFGYHDNLR